ncbi:Flp pilus assembly protein CpaB [Virgibacillus siamensis]|uniref:Flp pilus assembly protein CpaB n=1 Tax=Virgibacillus siamensis TaxID=480071 RepID=UPI00098644EC|nr:Flp pilus assembly protein CpaB [Virgibacillus siamensis]
MKAGKILLLALLSGIITTGIFYLVVIQSSPADSAEQKENQELEAVVVAGTDIKQDEKLTEENITIRQMVKKDIHEEAVRDKQEVIGQYASASLKAGEVILQHRVRKQNDLTAFVSRKINEKMRGVSIDVKYDESVSNLTVPEDFVDVYSNVITNDKTTPIEVRTERLLEKTRVLAVGERIVEKSKAEGEEPYITVTLEVTPEQATELIHAAQIGTFHLALHSRLKTDEKTEKTDSAAEAEKVESETEQSKEKVEANEDNKKSSKEENKNNDGEKNKDKK